MMPAQKEHKEGAEAKIYTYQSCTKQQLWPGEDGHLASQQNVHEGTVLKYSLTTLAHSPIQWNGPKAKLSVTQIISFKISSNNYICLMWAMPSESKFQWTHSLIYSLFRNRVLCTALSNFFPSSALRTFKCHGTVFHSYAIITKGGSFPSVHEHTTFIT